MPSFLLVVPIPTHPNKQSAVLCLVKRKASQQIFSGKASCFSVSKSPITLFYTPYVPCSQTFSAWPMPRYDHVPKVTTLFHLLVSLSRSVSSSQQLPAADATAGGRCDGHDGVEGGGWPLTCWLMLCTLQSSHSPSGLRI